MSESKAEAQSVIIELNDLAQDADHFGNTGDARVAREAIDLIERQAKIIEQLGNACEHAAATKRAILNRALTKQ